MSYVSGHPSVVISAAVQANSNPEDAGGEAEALWASHRTPRVVAVGGIRQRGPQTPELPEAFCKVWKPFRRSADNPLPEEGSAEWSTEFGLYLTVAMQQARHMAAEVGLPTEVAQMPDWEAQVRSLRRFSMSCMILATCFATPCPWGWGSCCFSRLPEKVRVRRRVACCTAESDDMGAFRADEADWGRSKRV